MSVRDGRWRQEVTAAAGAASSPVFFPRRVNAVTVKVIPGAGTAVARFTTDDPDDVRADPDNARWEDWDDGAVAAPTSRALTGPVTALRLEATGDAAEMHVVGAYDF